MFACNYCEAVFHILPEDICEDWIENYCPYCGNETIEEVDAIEHMCRTPLDK